MKRYLLVLLIFLTAVPSGAGAAKGRAARSLQLTFVNSEQELKKAYQAITPSSICDGLKRFFNIKGPTEDCDQLASKFPNGQTITMRLSRSSPGLRRFFLETTGSSERLAGVRAKGTETHRYDIVFMTDFDRSLYIHVFDMEPRVSARPPETANGDFVLMGREYDTQNLQFQARLASALADSFQGKIDVSIESANSQ